MVRCSIANNEQEKTDRYLLFGSFGRWFLTPNGKVQLGQRPPVAYILPMVREVLPMESAIHVKRKLLRDIAHRVHLWRVGLYSPSEAWQGNECHKQFENQSVLHTHTVPQGVVRFEA